MVQAYLAIEASDVFPYCFADKMALGGGNCGLLEKMFFAHDSEFALHNVTSLAVAN